MKKLKQIPVVAASALIGLTLTSCGDKESDSTENTKNPPKKENNETAGDKIKKAIDETEKDVKKIAGDVKEEVKKGAEDLKEATETTIKDIKDETEVKIGEVKDNTEKALNELKETSAKQTKSLKDAAEEMRKKKAAAEEKLKELTEGDDDPDEGGEAVVPGVIEEVTEPDPGG